LAGEDRNAAGTLAGLLKRSRRLSRVEERDLLRRAQQGDERARTTLIECNLRLVVYVARRYQSTSLTLEDLIQDGVLGLVDAIERFDPSGGNSLSSYAVPWIRLRVGRAVYRMSRIIRLPERGERLLSRWNQLCEQSADRQQAPPTVERGAEELGVSVETLQAVMEASLPMGSLAPLDEAGEQRGAEEYVADESLEDPLSHLLREEESSRLRRLLSELRPTYRQILEESYGLEGEPKTLSDLAARWGVTKQAVSGMRKRALAVLRERMLQPA
jgi:RNA polymerase sigma factor (sigma-70 family)